MSEPTDTSWKPQFVKGDRWMKVPVAVVTQPRPGRVCHAESYWYVTADEHVLFFQPRRNGFGGNYWGSPQCNTNENVLSYRLNQHGWEACGLPEAVTIRKLGYTFLPEER